MARGRGILERSSGLCGRVATSYRRRFFAGLPAIEASEPRRVRSGDSTLLRNLRVLLCWVLALRAIGLTPSRGADDPRTAAKDDAPTYIFLDAPADLDALRKKLARPDFVILKGALYDALKAGVKPIAPQRRAIVESVAVGGEVLDDLAHLAIDYGVRLAGDEPAWVPIRLDAQIVTGAREGDRDLPIRAADGGWQVQVKGDGPHRVQVSLSSVVLSAKGSAQGRRLELAIPEAASTKVAIALAANVSEVAATGAAGVREPLTVELIEGAQRGRVSAFLTPRTTLEIQWKVAADAGAAGPPLVTAQGEIAVEVDRGSIRARSSWEVRSERGSVRRLELRIDPADELVGLEFDGRPVTSDEPGDRGSGVIAVPLAEPLGPGRSGRLTVTTRRALSPESATRLTYRGVPLLNVVSQSGVLAISQSGGDPWVSASPGRGLRSIDPRTELPAGLRARPSIVLAYQFVEQPFELGLQVDPSPPWVRVESRTTVFVEGRRARVDAVFDYSVSRGRVFEIRVSLPEGLTIDAVGPEAVVAASEILAAAVPGGRRVLAVRLASRASEDGRFTLRLTGRQAIAVGKESEVGLALPVDSQSRGGLLAVLAARDVSVALGANPSGAPSEFSPAGQDVPASWPWPSEVDPLARSPVLWLRHDDAPHAIAMNVSTLEHIVREETTLDARIERKRIDVRQETVLRTRHGTLTRVDVAVPPGLDGLWEMEGAEVVRRDPLEPGPDGSTRYRLTLGRSAPDLARLRIRIRLPLATALEPDRATRLAIPQLTILDAETSPARVRVGAEDGIDLDGDGPGWSDPKDAGPPTVREPGPPWRIERAASGPARVIATAHAFASLPRVVASRLAMRSASDPEGGLRTTATYRLEAHQGSLVVSLPEGADLVRARVGSEAVAEVERVAESARVYRIRLPADVPGPLVVTLDYTQSAAAVAATGRWGAPKLADGAVIEESTWEVGLPGGVALAGVPEGWSDENQWFWNSYVFMRRPVTSVRAGPAGDLPRDGSHAYLFARVGGPVDLAPRIVSRAGLVGFCSGAVLVLGLVATSARRWIRAGVFLAIALALVAAVLAPPSVIPLVAQSSVLGFVLLAVAAATRTRLDRRRPAVPRGGESSGLGLSASGTSGRVAVADVGSEESTVIRARVGTTVERAPLEAAENLPAHVTG